MAEAVVELPNFNENGSRGSELTFNPVSAELSTTVVPRPSGDSSAPSYDPHEGAAGEKNTLDTTWDPGSAEFMTVEATPWSPSSGGDIDVSTNPFSSQVADVEVREYP